MSEQALSYKIRIENHNNELLPEYICSLPGKDKIVSNSSKNREKIYLEQEYTDFHLQRNELIVQYIREMMAYSQLAEQQQHPCFIMPEIGSLNGQKTIASSMNEIVLQPQSNSNQPLPALDDEQEEDDDDDEEEEEDDENDDEEDDDDEDMEPLQELIDNKDDSARNQNVHANKRKKRNHAADLGGEDTDNRPTKKRKLNLYEEEKEEPLMSLEEIEDDWCLYAKQQKAASIERMKLNLFKLEHVAGYLDVDGRRCSVCKSRFTGMDGRGQWYDSEDATCFCERCHHRHKNGLPRAHSHDDYEGIILSNILKEFQAQKRSSNGSESSSEIQRKKHKHTTKSKSTSKKPRKERKSSKKYGRKTRPCRKKKSRSEESEGETDEEGDDEEEENWTPWSRNPEHTVSSPASKRGSKRKSKEKEESKVRRKRSENRAKEDYEVDSIEGEAVDSSGKNTLYLVKWTNYGYDGCTWEPLQSFNGSKVIKAWNEKVKQNNYAFCQHGKYSIIPCFVCKKSKQNQYRGLKDLSKWDIEEPFE